MLKLLRLILVSTLIFFLNQAQAADLKKIEQELSDSVITTKITAKFTKNKNLNPLKILVTTTDGAVTLTGHVKDEQAFIEALRVTSTTKGVKSVDMSSLEIKRVNTVFIDAFITAKVEAAVLQAKILDDESIPIVGINASTTNGIVTLSGEVKNNSSVAAILKRVNDVGGVRKIISSLHVKTESQESQIAPHVEALLTPLKH